MQSASLLEALAEANKAQVTALQTNGNWGITTALAFGMTIMFLVYTFGHVSGGHINCAVTLGLVLTGHCGPLQGFFYFLAQVRAERGAPREPPLEPTLTGTLVKMTYLHIYLQTNYITFNNII